MRRSRCSDNVISTLPGAPITEIDRPLTVKVAGATAGDQRAVELRVGNGHLAMQTRRPHREMPVPIQCVTGPREKA